MSNENLCLKLTDEDAVQLWLFLGNHLQILEDEFSSNPSEGLQNQIANLKEIINKVFELIKPEPDFSDLEGLRTKL